MYIFRQKTKKARLTVLASCLLNSLNYFDRLEKVYFLFHFLGTLGGMNGNLCLYVYFSNSLKTQ